MAGTRKKRPGRHKLECRCINCNTRRKREREAANQPSNPEPSLSPFPGTTEKSSEAGGAAADFAAASASVVAEAGAGISPVGETVPAPDPQLLQLPWGMQIDIRQQTIKEHWLPAMSNAAAAATHDPEMGLAEWEYELWAPAVTGMVNYYLPKLLENTERPELAMFAVAAGSYILTRPLKMLALVRRIPALGKLIPGTSAPVTSMPESRESPAFSAPPALEKRIEPQSLSVDAIAVSGSTQ